jgi:hypothetical protein
MASKLTVNVQELGEAKHINICFEPVETCELEEEDVEDDVSDYPAEYTHPQR